MKDGRRFLDWEPWLATCDCDRCRRATALEAEALVDAGVRDATDDGVGFADFE